MLNDCLIIVDEMVAELFVFTSFLVLLLYQC